MSPHIVVGLKGPFVSAKLPRLIFLLLFAVPLFFASCADQGDDEADKDFGDYLAQGKRLLAQNDGVGAGYAFQNALLLREGDAEARFGLILANIMRFPNIIDGILDTINGLSFAEKKMPAGPGPAAPGENEIKKFFLEKICGELAENEVLYAELITEPDFGFQFE